MKYVVVWRPEGSFDHQTATFDELNSAIAMFRDLTTNGDLETKLPCAELVLSKPLE